MMPYVYSPTYYEDQKKEHDFYVNLGNKCKIAEEHRQTLRKLQLEERELQRQYEILQGYKRKLDEAKRIAENHNKLSHAWMEYNYTKDKELLLFSDSNGMRISWRDSLSPEEEAAYREHLRRDLGSDKIDVVNKIR